MSVDEDYEGKPPGNPAVDEGDLTLLNTNADSFSISTGTAKFDSDIIATDPALGGNFAGRYSGTGFASIILRDPTPVLLPEMRFRVRFGSSIGVISGSPIGTTSEGAIVLMAGDLSNIGPQMILAGGGIQVLQSTGPANWKLLKPDGTLTSLLAEADLTMFTVETSFDCRVVNTGPNAWDFFVDGVKKNTVPLPTRNAGVGPFTRFQTGRLTVVTDIFYGDTAHGDLIPPGAVGSLLLAKP